MLFNTIFKDIYEILSIENIKFSLDIYDILYYMYGYVRIIIYLKFKILV